MLAGLKHIDFVTAWKALSIALTGAFGILGLLKDFKDKQTKKVTNWGWVSLVGILVSSILGIAAQLKESADDSAKALALSQKTERTLSGIERGLYRLEEPNVLLNFEVPCDEHRYKSFCQRIHAHDFLASPGLDARDWVGWPGKAELIVEMNFFVNKGDAEHFEAEPQFGKSDLSLIVLDSNTPGKDHLFALPQDAGKVQVQLSDRHPEIVWNDGKLASLLDFNGATLVLSSLTEELSDLRLKGFEIQTKSGQRIGTYGESELEKKTTIIDTLYIYEFPR